MDPSPLTLPLWLGRPADFVDPNEAAWVEPDQQAEQGTKAAEKSPSPEPEPSDGEESMDGEWDRTVGGLCSSVPPLVHRPLRQWDWAVTFIGLGRCPPYWAQEFRINLSKIVFVVGKLKTRVLFSS